MLLLKPFFYKYESNLNRSVQYGSDMEVVAKLKFEELSSLKVNSCGLYIDKEYPFLAASPG